MRIIKFRGKDVKTSHWVYGGFHKHIDITPSALYKDAESRENHIKEHTHYLIIQDAFSDYCRPRNIQCFDVSPETVGQFTGLCDKNGKAIYEGDILRISKFTNLVCEFRHGAFGYMYYNKFYPFAGNRRYAFNPKNTDKEFEVIGNIHDNPELLKGGWE